MTNWLSDMDYSDGRASAATGADDLLGRDGDEQVRSDALSLADSDVAYIRTLMDTHLASAEGHRAEHVALADEYQRMYDLTPYEQSELLTDTAESIRTPMTTARVDQTHGTMTGALATDPFALGAVEEGQDGTVAKAVENAMNERLKRADAISALSGAIRNSLVTTIGYIKTTVVQNEDGVNVFELESPRMRDVYLVPHNPRRLDDCTLVAERSFETIMNIRILADDGFYDQAAVDELGEGGDAEGETPDHEFLGLRPDGESIEILEAYIRVRNRRADGKDAGGETMYRVFYARQRGVVLRIEEWTDGFPYRPFRHDRHGNTLYARAYPALLRDINYTADQIFSATLEQDRLGLSSLYVVDPASSAWVWINEKINGGEVPIQGGEVLAANPAQVQILNHAPTPLQVNDRINLLENYANLATISAMPFQTVRAATEVRFVAGQIQQQEQQMLRAFRADIEDWLEYCKRLMWKYMTQDVDDDLLDDEHPSLPAPEQRAQVSGIDPSLDEMDTDEMDEWDTENPDALVSGIDPSLTGVFEPGMLEARENVRWLTHGTKAVRITEAAYRAVRLVPRGTSTQADQILAQQSSQVLMTAVLPQVLQKQAMQQAGAWPAVYDILRRVCEANGIQDYARILGPDPTVDPNVVDLSGLLHPTQQAQLGMQLAGTLGTGGQGAGGFQAMQQAFGLSGAGAARGDGTVTSQPGGPSANGSGLF